MGTLIESWSESHASDGIVALTESQVLEPTPAYPDWMNLVAQRSVRAIAIAPKSRHVWMTTWGGVLSWRQREESIYYRYSSEHGMASNSVACLCIDELERPWIGHDEGGLSYFDGEHWRVSKYFQNEPVRALARAGADTLWVAIANAIYQIDINDEQKPLPVAIAQDGSASVVTLLPDGHELLVGNQIGLFRLSRGGAAVRIEPETINGCVGLARDGRGQVWIATAHEIFQLANGQGVSSPVYSGEGGRVKAISAGHERLWILSAEGISQTKDKIWRPLPLSGEATAPALHAIAASSNDNHLWVGTDRVLSSVYYGPDGQASWDYDTLPQHPEDQLSNLGRCAAATQSDGRVWIGTGGGLVICEDADKWSVDATRGDVRALCVADYDPADVRCETVWMLSWPDGIICQGQRVPVPAGVPISLARGRHGAAYALTSKGIWRLGNQIKQVAEAPPLAPHCCAQTADGHWWVGTLQGVYEYTKGKWRRASAAPGPRLAEVNALAIVHKQLWAATENGLFVRAGDGWIEHNDHDLSFVRVLAAAGDREKLWLALADGIVRYDPVNRTIDKPYTTFEHGLASRRVTAMVESGGNLWIATEAGISRLKLTGGN